MKKRLISMLLLVVMVLGMIPATALAASSEEEALGEVNIYNGEQKLSYLSINGRIRELIYTYFNHVDANGRTKEIPAYCVNPNTTGVPQTVAPGESIKYIAKEKGNDPKVMGIIANGYPTRGLSELKLENKYHAYYATKMALWCYLLPNWNINNLKVNPNLTGAELQRARAILARGASAGAGYPCRRQGHLCAWHGVEQDILAPCYRCPRPRHRLCRPGGRTAAQAAGMHRPFRHMGM